MRSVARVLCQTHLLTSTTLSMHTKCRGGAYPFTKDKVQRVQIPDSKVDWDVEFAEYLPPCYTAPHILAAPPYADPEIGAAGFKPRWNALDGRVSRCSHVKPYDVVDGFPRNVCGRTGVAGRGALGRWGPNHAADPIVTRWKVADGKAVIHEKTRKPILQFVCIQRRDSGHWAIPGGMVDPGERVTTTLQREFLEEALNSLEMTEKQKEKSEKQLKELFKGGVEIYSGYVDDPRNTDNAWMETVAFNFHQDDLQGVLYSMLLHAGDDAKAVKWQDISSTLNLYASHEDMIEKVAHRHQAHWSRNLAVLPTCVCVFCLLVCTTH
ncbi:ADP-ribose pyrophosphatase, mitochondrial-like [Scylla paramamosain]|uniref:ADP-ribose pyrophosphatase, mitochondrial-like n=1 Tax=Scylla paramamosain TaxID=85552 RepID=UPI003083749A